MVRVLLFGPLAEAAAARELELSPGRLDELLDAARAACPPEFAAVLARSRVWINGEPATGDEHVADGDEVALLPPVSGG